MATEKPDNRQALTAGTELLWYRIRGILGQGAFGITYLADDLNLGRPVALKEYLPLQLASRVEDGGVAPVSDDTRSEFDNGLKRFINEAKTLAKFEHPNIVRVHNVFEFGNTAYMVMNYEEGETLAQLLRRDKRLDEPKLLAILLPLLEGLEAIHAAGFIHRDIKPGNIFIRTDGTPVLIDFGSARDAMQGDARTITNFVSPGYAPIEQYTSKSDKQGPWSDIYALGATVYRCITGRAPIPAVDRGESIAQDDGDTYRPGEIAGHKGYSEPLLRAVDHALQFRINDRPQTIAAWRHDFGGASAGAGMPAALDPTGPARRNTRQPARTAAALVAVLGALGVLGGSVYFTTRD
ncbi:MAG: serine/threonine protein kinase, partial [Gammaproteobacteria bacterium]|nr:serine/threonine protein kinase [Gammaproteobacteria bacterium]